MVRGSSPHRPKSFNSLQKWKVFHLKIRAMLFNQVYRQKDRDCCSCVCVCACVYFLYYLWCARSNERAQIINEQFNGMSKNRLWVSFISEVTRCLGNERKRVWYKGKQKERFFSPDHSPKNFTYHRLTHITAYNVLNSCIQTISFCQYLPHCTLIAAICLDGFFLCLSGFALILAYACNLAKR